MKIDFTFGLSQLSGDKSLLILLLGKIRNEYTGCDITLLRLFKNEQWTEAKIIVHTLKGVSGNLGCQALHAITKAIDEELKHANSVPKRFSEFADILNATLSLIKQVEETGSIELKEKRPEARQPEVPQELPQEAPTKNINHVALKKLLLDNAFISPTILDDHLATIDLDAEKKDKLKHYINTLDYIRALELLNS